MAFAPRDPSRYTLCNIAHVVIVSRCRCFFRRCFADRSAQLARALSASLRLGMHFPTRCWKLSPSFVSQLVNVTRTPLHLRNVIEIPLCAFNCTRNVKFESNGRGVALVDGVSRCTEETTREKKQRSNERQKNSGNNVFVAA